MDLGSVRNIAQTPDRFDPQPAGDAVVERLGDELVAHLEERFVHYHHVANLDLLGGSLAQPGIDDELMHLRHLLAVFHLGDVNAGSGGVHHGLEVAAIGADQHAAGKERARIEPTHGLQVEKALLGDVAHEETDLVHMAEQHDLQRIAIAAPRIPAAQQRAHRVRLDMIEQAFGLLQDEVADPVLVTGNARGFAEALEKIGIHGSLHGSAAG